MRPAPGAMVQRLRQVTGADLRAVPRPRPLPQVHLDLKGGMPVWLVRAAAAVLFLAAAALVVTGPVQAVLAAAAAVAIVASRTGTASSLGIALLLVAFLARHDPQGWLGLAPPWQTAGLLVGIHGCAHLTRRCSELGARARIERSALAAGALPAVLINAFAQVVNLLVVSAHGLRATAVTLAGLVALTLVCWLVAHLLRDQE